MLTKVEKYRMWKRLRGYIPKYSFRNESDHSKYIRYSGYLAEYFLSEQDRADHTLELLKRR